MTTRTKWITIAAVAYLVIGGGLELVLARAMTAPTIQGRAEVWAKSLSVTSRSWAIAHIEEYPFAYRRELMRPLPRSARAEVFVQHIGRYVAAHPELNPEQRTLADELQRFFAAEAKDDLKLRPQNLLIADRLKKESIRLFGEDTTKDLLARIGGRGAEPWTQRASAWLTRNIVVAAREDEADSWCECHIGFSSCWGSCSQRRCKAWDAGFYWEGWVLTWQGCGMGFIERCDGMCNSEQET